MSLFIYKGRVFPAVIFTSGMHDSIAKITVSLTIFHDCYIHVFYFIYNNLRGYTISKPVIVALGKIVVVTVEQLFLHITSKFE